MAVATKGKDTMIVNPVCHICREEENLAVGVEDFHSWKRGDALIQNAMPYLTPSQRELLISGICGSLSMNKENLP